MYSDKYDRLVELVRLVLHNAVIIDVIIGEYDTTRQMIKDIITFIKLLFAFQFRSE